MEKRNDIVVLGHSVKFVYASLGRDRTHIVGTFVYLLILDGIFIGFLTSLKGMKWKLVTCCIDDTPIEIYGSSRKDCIIQLLEFYR